MWWRGIVGALVAACLALAAVPSAQAGTYTVWSCSDSSGSPAPTEGWSSAASNLAPGGGAAGNGCAAITVVGTGRTRTGRATGISPTGLTTIFDGNPSTLYPTYTYARWDYAAPPGTTISTVAVVRVGEGMSVRRAVLCCMNRASAAALAPRSAEPWNSLRSLH
jgi:hypothetical protein